MTLIFHAVVQVLSTSLQLIIFLHNWAFLIYSDHEVIGNLFIGTDFRIKKLPRYSSISFLRC